VLGKFEVMRRVVERNMPDGTTISDESIQRLVDDDWELVQEFIDHDYGIAIIMDTVRTLGISQSLSDGAL
jgi:hypothetical protein